MGNLRMRGPERWFPCRLELINSFEGELWWTRRLMTTL
jgi:hypothetical protein